MVEAHVDVAVELLGPVAFFADVLRRPEVLDRRLDRPLVVGDRVGDELVHAVDLRLEKPLRARADVAFHAIDARVRAAFVGHELRVHRPMADLPAELHRLGILVGLVTAKRAQQQKSHGADPEQREHPALFAIGEIQPPLVRLRRRMLDGPASLRPRAEDDDRESGDQEARRDEIRQNSEIWIPIALREIHPHQEREREQRPRRQHDADRRDPVVEVRTRLRRTRFWSRVGHGEGGCVFDVAALRGYASVINRSGLELPDERHEVLDLVA